MDAGNCEHTPGPWFEGDIGEGQTILVGPLEDADYPVAAVFNMRNVPLIAAAPEMLSELRRLHAQYGHQATADIIAKATGAAQA